MFRLRPGAANLLDDAPVRHRARERRLRRDDQALDLDPTIAGRKTPARRIRSRSSATPSCRGAAGHPDVNIVMLTADAFARAAAHLPADARPPRYVPISYPAIPRRSRGTEKGGHRAQGDLQMHLVFGAPFLPLPAGRYARMAWGENRAASRACLAGQYGVERWPLRHRRAHEDWIHTRDDQRPRCRAPSTTSPTTRIRSSTLTCRPRVPQPVPPDVLKPRSTWRSPAEHDDAQAAKLAKMFADNFKTFDGDVTAGVRAAGPRV